MMTNNHSIQQPPYDTIAAVGNRTPIMDDSFFGSCDFTSYSYFTLAIALFTGGAIVAIVYVDVGSASMFGGVGHMWLVGPLFVSSGVMVALKTVLYLRKKNMMMFIMQRRAMLRELQTVHVQVTVTRSPSSVTLPPSYELVVDCPTHGDVHQPLRTVRYSGELPPPSYEEAMVLINGDDQLTVTTTTIVTTSPTDQEQLDDVQRHVLAIKDVDG